MAVGIWWYESRSCWCADVPTGNGRKRLYLGPDKNKAQAQFHRYLASYYEEAGPEAADSKPVRRRAGDLVSLLELSVRFIQWTKDSRAPGTWRQYRDGLKHITRRYRDKLALDLTPADVEKVKSEMIAGGKAARTINIMVGSVKRLYSWGVKQGLVALNPVEGLARVSKHVNAPKTPQQKHLPLEFALECIRLCRCSSPLGEMCELMLLTGMRVGEVVKVTWQDVDFQQRMLNLQQHKTSGHTNRPRTIPLSERAMQILKAQAQDDFDSTKTVFKARDGQPFTVDNMHNRLQRIRKKHPKLKAFSFHKLRHTCATYLARRGVAERVAQAILGHSSVLMTRYYTASSRQEMIDAAEILSKDVQDGEK